MKAVIYLISASLFLLTACQGPEPYMEQPKNRVDRMTRVERADMAPNELFIAVFNGDLQEADRLSQGNLALLTARNQKEGNTPLGVAMELEEKEIAGLLFQRMPLKYFFEGNNLGESTVLQASRLGWTWMIEALADRYYRSLGQWNDYEFSDLDFPDHMGRKALHVARSGHVAEVLENEYYRGFLEVPVWQFTHHTDSEGKTFLHTASRDSRKDVLRWGVMHFCGVNSWEKEGGWFFGSLGFAYERTQRAFQTYVGGLGLSLEQRFNQQDVLGKTPLHYVSDNRDYEALRIITNCEWIDFSLEDSEGNISLQSFLMNLPENESRLKESDLKFLRLLSEQRTQMRKWFRSKNDYINHQNRQGNSALHFAAKLADPRPYQILSQSGNVELLNKNGISALEIYNSRTARLRRYDH